VDASERLALAYSEIDSHRWQQRAVTPGRPRAMLCNCGSGCAESTRVMSVNRAECGKATHVRERRSNRIKVH